MRVAALCAIYGQPSAPEAVFVDVVREDVDATVLGGNSSSEPWPVEVLRGA